MFRKYVLPYLVFAIYSAIKFTWRLRIVESESFQKAMREGRPMIFAHWHGDELGIVHLIHRYRAAVMVSTSKDGDLMNAVVGLIGGKTSRGSSTRGGVGALKGILRLSRDGWRPAIAVDGPKGPYHKVKPGVFEISKLIGGEIFPLTAAADRQFVFKKAWNKSFLPLPFARVQIVWGDALAPIARDADPHDPDLAKRLEEALTNAGQQARNLIAAT